MGKTKTAVAAAMMVMMASTAFAASWQQANQQAADQHCKNLVAAYETARNNFDQGFDAGSVNQAVANAYGLDQVTSQAVTSAALVDKRSFLGVIQAKENIYKRCISGQ